MRDDILCDFDCRASREVYHDSLRNYSGVDISEQMLRIAEELLARKYEII